MPKKSSKTATETEQVATPAPVVESAAPVVEKKAKKTGAATPVKKPPAKSAGRGR